MSLHKSLVYRVGVGKAIGLVVGLFGFISLPYFLSDASLTLRFGVLFWYSTMGAFIGIFGLFAYHPVLKFKMPWWFRGALIGGWMNFVLCLIAYQQLCLLVASVFGEYSIFASPYWMVLEGAVIGLMVDFILTVYFGEGEAIAT